jgi:L-ascorbate metabolism protein UlaG (beta-lactamase superfamily)
MNVSLKWFPPSWAQIMGDAAKAARAIKPAAVVPMHHLKTDPREFKNKLEARSTIEARI